MYYVRTMSLVMQNPNGLSHTIQVQSATVINLIILSVVSCLVLKIVVIFGPFTESLGTGDRIV